MSIALLVGLPSATVRAEIADYISAVIYVYILLILLHIILRLIFSFGYRPPYSRARDSLIAFLHDVCEPYLGIFRRLLPSFGAFDFSPIVAVLVLELLNSVVVEGLIHG